MENNLRYIVYCTINKQTNFIYIGVHQTINPDVFDGYLGCGVINNRPHTYQYAKTKFQQAVKEYGPKNFVRKTIAVFDDKEDAYMLEEDIVNNKYLQRNDVYNQVIGGRGGNGVGIKTYQYDLDGNYLNEFNSINLAAIYVERSMRSIWRAVKEKIKCANYFWSFEKYDVLNLEYYKTTIESQGFPVFQYSESGEYECCYESISDTARIMNVDKSNLQTAIKLGYLCYNKYYSVVYSPNYSIAKSEYIKRSEIHQYSLNGEYIQSWKNQRIAQKTLGFTSNIYNAIKLGRSCGNYLWSIEKLDRIAPQQPKSGKVRKVGKYDKDWNLIQVYDTITACKKDNGAGLIHVLSGRDEFAKGFRYKYID